MNDCAPHLALIERLKATKKWDVIPQTTAYIKRELQFVKFIL